MRRCRRPFRPFRTATRRRRPLAASGPSSRRPLRTAWVRPSGAVAVVGPVGWGVWACLVRDSRRPGLGCLAVEGRVPSRPVRMPGLLGATRLVQGRHRLVRLKGRRSSRPPTPSFLSSLLPLHFFLPSLSDTLCFPFPFLPQHCIPTLLPPALEEQDNPVT